MLANYLTNNDPDKWLDMMNKKSLKRARDDQYQMVQQLRVPLLLPSKGYYSPQRYDNNQNQQNNCAWFGYHDLYNFIKKCPEFSSTLANLLSQLKREHLTSENHLKLYNYSIPGA